MKQIGACVGPAMGERSHDSMLIKEQNRSVHKILKICLVVTILLLGQIQVGSATDFTCPDSWTVRNEKDLAENVASANSSLKLTYGNTSKISTKTGWIFDASGENLFFSNSLNSDGEKIHGTWALILSLVIPSTENFYVVTVSIDHCENPGIFKFPYNHSTSVKRIPLTSWDNNSEIDLRLQSKTMKETIKSFLESKISSIKLGNFLKGGRNYKALKLNEIQGIPFSILDPFSPRRSNLDDHVFMLLPTAPGCIRFGENYELNIPKGKSCKFAVAMSDDEQVAARSQSPMANLDLIVIEDLQIPLIELPSAITCTKGKVTKKVSGTNPKCPKGYKKAI